MRLWAVPVPKPVERRRYVAGVDDMALMLGISALLGGGGALAGMMGNQNRQGGGYDIIYPKQPSYSEPRMRLTSDFITQNLNRLQEGKFPAWYEGISPLLKKQQQLGLNQAYYGTQFTPGIFNQTASYDAARGLGTGAAASRSYGAQQQNYAQQEKAIDDYISQLGYQAQQSDAYQMPQLSMQLSQDERAWGSPVGVYPVAPQQNNWDSIANILGSASGSIPWLAMMGNNATSASTSSTSPYSSQTYSPTYLNSDTGYTMGNNYGGSFAPNTMNLMSSYMNPSYNFGQNAANNISYVMQPQQQSMWGNLTNWWNNPSANSTVSGGQLGKPIDWNSISPGLSLKTLYGG